MSRSYPPQRLRADGRLDLPEVTLVAASSKALAATVRALRQCLTQVRPADAILFTDVSPPAGVAGLRFVKTEEMEDRRAYSRFMLKGLARHVETDFALCVQWDGYILDARNWSEDFLSVDYVGAPWPQFSDGHDVGNGGFSLRSRRLLQACTDQRIGEHEAEDIAICRGARSLLEGDFGIRFADRGLASRFAYERTAAGGNEFGFHGAFNMSRLMDRAEYRNIIASLEPGVLRRSDVMELLKNALARRDIKSARVLSRSLRSSRLAEAGARGIMTTRTAKPWRLRPHKDDTWRA